jgi:putative selenium metabolism hydrolase
MQENVAAENKELVELVQEMIRIRSYTGEEGELVSFLKKAMLAKGFDEITVDEVGNLTGTVRGTHPGPVLLFDGHLDTVEIGNPDDWEMDPFSGDIREGFLYGRGTSDMKGALGAMIHAAGCIDKENLWGSITVSGTVDEEVAEGISLHRVLDAIEPDLVVIGESSALRLNTGQRGRAEISLKTFGKRAHSASPQVGVNAVKKMMKLLAGIEAYRPQVHPVLGGAILELTDIISSPYPGASVVPELCEVTFDRRLLPGDTQEVVLAEIEALLLPNKEEIHYELAIRGNDVLTWTGKELGGVRFAPAWNYDVHETWNQTAHQLLSEAGLVEGLGTYAFCTNGSASAGVRNIPTIGYGPGNEVQAHTVDEYIELDSLVRGAKGYQLLMQQMGKEWRN